MRQLIEDERDAREGLRSTALDSVSFEQSLNAIAEQAQRNGIPEYRSRVKGVKVGLQPAIRNEA